MRLLFILSLFAAMQAGQPAAHKQSDPIEENELGEFLAQQNDCTADQIYFSVLEHFDFLSKGYDQAVVVASTCMTGTAGPDIHSVYTRDAKGELEQLKFEEVKPAHRVLFGNSNSTFVIEDGLIVERYGDTSDRDDPLVIKYKWDPAKREFVAVSVDAAKPYPTSYDCEKAEKDQDETAQAICYVKPLADLDLHLAKTYKAYLAALDAASRKSSIQEQRDWLAERNKKCTIYKWWVECLTESYNKRITELQRRIAEQKTPASARASTPRSD
jgi:uncharacterized protein YecT (DUF1311 family)